MLVARDSKIIRDDWFKGFSPFSEEHREVTIESAVQSLLENCIHCKEAVWEIKVKSRFSGLSKAELIGGNGQASRPLAESTLKLAF